MKMTPRQRQISVLKQRGASDKEIASVLGIEVATVKSHSKRLREVCKDEGVDIFAMPLERSERMKRFEMLARVTAKGLRFGEETAE